jgi:hypothetical protein
MAEVVLFHYDGEVFDDLDDGQRKEEALGYQEIARKAAEAAARLPTGLIFAAVSGPWSS